jgi:hypothetical protein
MSEPVSERDLVLESLPITADSEQWRQFEAQVLGRTEGCPATTKLIDYLCDPGTDKTGEVAFHLQSGCRYCNSWYRGYTRPPEAEPMAAVQEVLRRHAVPVSAEPESVGQPVAPETTTAPQPAEAERPALWPWSEESQSLAHSFMRADDPQAIRALRPFLSNLLDYVGLDRELEGQFARFLDRQVQVPPSGLPGWLDQFAREDLGLRALPLRLRPKDWKRAFLRLALDYLASNPPRERASVGLDRVQSVFDRVRQDPVRCASLYAEPPDWETRDSELRKLAKEADLPVSEIRKLVFDDGHKYARTMARRYGPRQKV